MNRTDRAVGNRGEEVLPARFGGVARDYQFLEEEDADGFTRLSVVVHPRLGAIDEGAVLDCVGEFVARDQAGAFARWRPAGTLRVLRAEPMMSPAAKVVPLHRVPAPGSGSVWQ